MKNNQRTAFSLFELSIVILVIALLTTIIVSGSKLVKKSKIANIANLTSNSPVSQTPNLILWYETSLASSFKKEEQKNDTAISSWFDNGQQEANRNNATQSNSGNRPKYIENVFNEVIPAVRFNNSDQQYFNFDGSKLINNSYTIFIVEQRTSAATAANFILGGSGNQASENLIFGYENSTTIRSSHFASDLDFTVPAYSSKIPRIHSIQFSSSNGRKYWLNGGTTPDASNPALTTAVSQYQNPYIGRFASSYYFTGDIGEIIIFNRVLLTSERQKIEFYLSKKYNIKIE